MKKAFLFLCKFLLSGIFAVSILSLFALVYYNPPKAVAQPDKYTNSKFVSNTYWSDMTEGMGCGKTNNLGYNEKDHFSADVSVVALIGSSHTEALQVPQNETYTALLQQQLQEAGSENIDCLNLGKSGHFLNISVSNFEYFAETFSNVECAVIETSNLHFSASELEKMLAGEYHADFQERGGLYSLAQRIPYLRLAYKQYQDTRQKSGGVVSTTEPFDYAAYDEGVNRVMHKLSAIAIEKDFPLVILYHGSFKVQDLQAVRTDDSYQVEIFRQCCEQNGIRFVDVTDNFVEHFNSTYELPYGFANTQMGTGHLNKLGHGIVAETLYDHIAEMTEGE